MISSTASLNHEIKSHESFFIMFFAVEVFRESWF